MTLRTLATLAVLPGAFAVPTLAQAQIPTLHGRVLDPLGAVVPGAHIELSAVGLECEPAHVGLNSLSEGCARMDVTTSGPDGSFRLSVAHPGRYVITLSKQGFPATHTAPRYLGGTDEEQDLTLDTPTLSEEVTVTATGTPQPLARSGAPITVLNQQQDYLHFTEIQDPLRLVPGLQLTQTGQAGGTTSLMIRGGQGTYNKVLLDGVPVNDVGGNAEFANLATVGISRIEVLRQPNSVLYGSDDLSGVVLLTTTRGTTPLPELTYAIDGGDLGQLRQEADLAGAHKRFDYATGVARFQTQNNEPDDEFHNVTSFANAGYALTPATDLRFIWRHLDTNGGQPNALALYGIPDLANQKEQDTYLTGSANQQTTARWHNELQYGHQALNSQFIQTAAAGINVGYATLGLNETITGANGYSVTGQAILDFLPLSGTYATTARRDFVYAQSDYHVNQHLNLLGAFRYEAERGTATGATAVSEGNYSYTLQAAGDFASRFFYTLGSGIEDNAVYGKALTPRASVAYYLVRPGGNSLLTGTKLHASFGKGVKEGSVNQQASSLYDQLTPAQIAQYSVSPLGAEYSRTYDVGLEQQFANGRARANLSYFHNEYTNGIQFLSQAALMAIGVRAAGAPALEFGAYVNSQAYRSEGAELELEYRLSTHLFARAGYTYLDAVEQRSFSSDAFGNGTQNPSSNFATIQIGAYAPLDGARPFRLAPHSGYFALNYTTRRLTTQLSGTLVGKRDDSDFLLDASFGPSLLLPNRNLDGAYERLDLMADYRVNHTVTLYANLNNLLNQTYQEAFGFNALPLTVRGGVKFTLGGESFRLR